MKRVLKIAFSLAFILLTLQFTGCTNKNVLIDKSVAIENHDWTYVNKVRFDVNIEDVNAAYNLYINLRITGDYRYSNMFILLTQAGPDKKPVVKRYELKLATKEGEWLGSGSCNLYNYQLPVQTGYTFPAKGDYTFFIEQNMRDNPLREVSDVGLRVEKASR